MKNELLKKISNIILNSNKINNKSDVIEIAEKLTKLAMANEEIEIRFSHGDLQSGNIWIENKTNKIFIIDWESWGMRSKWYDIATLYQNLRPGGLEAYFSVEVLIEERAVVILEDLIFYLEELMSLPMNFGQDQFLNYIEILERELKEI